jgi:hypothetical protein
VAELRQVAGIATDRKPITGAIALSCAASYSPVMCAISSNDFTLLRAVAVDQRFGCIGAQQFDRGV